ncbi:MAG TPA: molybdopterin converting factor subunit 1 [Chromatiaceae bacterium]|nr:molybdopterin converting factor subunit 1 [Chromatiaceae bacterium]HIB83998.1 molybdopterin converting factor subunit 1 [Chromatiaceae bacterium]HIN81461.1 molybdopterin converting factor subunit 1 [Chromatiales bacterium]HIO14097.1 molybdopterin converting factor subunit 1 [Chromatiales bacterium]HIO54246.1 molybdopterin converting factor subunit 1 [Chromatiales bacterium]
MVQLQFFASIREALGVGDEQLELPEDVRTVMELRYWLQQRSANWDQALSGTNILTAINHELVQGDANITDGDEIAWFPPVTGG